MVRISVSVLALLLLLLPGCAPPAEKGEAEVPPPPPKLEAETVDMSTVEAPTPGHETLGMWVGTWEGSGDLMDSPMGPGGPMQWTEECDWFGEAKYNVVCTSEGSGAMGETKGLGIMGYKPKTETYTHYGIDTQGWTGHSKGERDGDTFVFRSKEVMGDQTFHTRMTMKMSENDTRATFVWETSPDGESWTTLMEGETTKIR